MIARVLIDSPDFWSTKVQNVTRDCLWEFQILYNKYFSYELTITNARTVAGGCVFKNWKQARS